MSTSDLSIGKHITDLTDTVFQGTYEWSGDGGLFLFLWERTTLRVMICPIDYEITSCAVWTFCDFPLEIYWVEKNWTLSSVLNLEMFLLFLNIINHLLIIEPFKIIDCK